MRAPVRVSITGYGPSPLRRRCPESVDHASGRSVFASRWVRPTSVHTRTSDPSRTNATARPVGEMVTLANAAPGPASGSVYRRPPSATTLGEIGRAAWRGGGERREAGERDGSEQ